MNYRNPFIFILMIAGLLIFSSCQKNKAPIPIPAKDKNVVVDVRDLKYMDPAIEEQIYDFKAERDKRGIKVKIVS